VGKGGKEDRHTGSTSGRRIGDYYSFLRGRVGRDCVLRRERKGGGKSGARGLLGDVRLFWEKEGGGDSGVAPIFRGVGGGKGG